MKTLTYTANALKDLRALDKTIAKRLVGKIELYVENPAALANKVVRLKGSARFRLRVGDYRIIFTEDAVILTIIKIGHRRDIYD